MQAVNVLFNGFNFEVSLELRGAPGAFVALGWLDDKQHADLNGGIDDNEQWQNFHVATNGAFEELGSRTAWIPASAIQWIREV